MGFCLAPDGLALVPDGLALVPEGLGALVLYLIYFCFYLIVLPWYLLVPQHPSNCSPSDQGMLKVFDLQTVAHPLLPLRGNTVWESKS